MNKITLTLLGAGALLCASCASNQSGLADSTIREVELLAPQDSATLQLLAKAKQERKDGQTTAAYKLASEALLATQSAQLAADRDRLAATRKVLADSLALERETRDIYQNVLTERKNAPQVQEIAPALNAPALNAPVIEGDAK
jgi:hypothetical protein